MNSEKSEDDKSGITFKTILYGFYKLLFTVALVLLVVKSYGSRGRELNFLKANFQNFFKKFLGELNSDSLFGIIIIFKNINLLVGAFLLLIGNNDYYSIFNLNYGKLAITLSFLIQILLIYNPFIYKEEKIQTISWSLVGITGIVFSI